MLEMGADGHSLLYPIFQWYPLQENFLNAAVYDDVRKEQVVFGVRRIMHPVYGDLAAYAVFCH